MHAMICIHEYYVRVLLCIEALVPGYIVGAYIHVRIFIIIIRIYYYYIVYVLKVLFLDILWRHTWYALIIFCVFISFLVCIYVLKALFPGYIARAYIHVRICILPNKLKRANMAKKSVFVPTTTNTSYK
jgi:hypothetical protein